MSSSTTRGAIFTTLVHTSTHSFSPHLSLRVRTFIFTTDFCAFLPLEMWYYRPKLDGIYFFIYLTFLLNLEKTMWKMWVQMKENGKSGLPVPNRFPEPCPLEICDSDWSKRYGSTQKQPMGLKHWVGSKTATTTACNEKGALQGLRDTSSKQKTR